MRKKVKKSMVMSSNQLDVVIEDDRWKISLEDIEIWSEFVFEEVVDFLYKKDLGFDGWKGQPIFVTLALSNDEHVQSLNYEFRGKDKPTNVLSFANIDDDAFFDVVGGVENIELGDIIIALETLNREADEKKVPLKNHFAHLLVHGILHLFGYDHQEDDEAEEMESIEIEILKKFGINNPYEG